MSYFGDFLGTETAVTIPFNAFTSDDPSASVTVTDLANTDVVIFKDGSLTQRSSASGVAVDIDVDTNVGMHWITIDLTDNTDAGFYSTGSQFTVGVVGMTVDGATVTSWVGTFTIGKTQAAMTAALVAHNLDHLALTATAGADMTTEVADNTILSRILANGDTSAFTPSTDGFQPLRDHIGDGTNLTEAGGDGDHLTEAGGTGDQLTAINLPNQTMDITGDITGSLSGSVGSVTAGVSLADDAITASKFDEATAFPLAAADTGATEVARTGADGDTLEDLSDEIAGVSGLDAAGVRTALGMASADLDDQLDALPTAVENREEMDSNSTQLAAIVEDTGTTIPGTITTIDGIVDDILEDTGTTIPAVLTTIAEYLDTEIGLILEDSGTTLPGLIAALENISAAEVNAEVVDALNVDTYGEIGQEAPSATASLAYMLRFIYKYRRNKKTQTADTFSLFNDAGAVVDQKATVSDDDTTGTFGKMGTGA